MSDRAALIRTGLLLPAVAGYTTALIAVLAPDAAGVAAAVVAAAVVPAVLVAVRRRARALVLVAAGALACCAVLASVAVREPARHPGAIEPGREAEVLVRVDAVTVTSGGGASGALVSRRILRGTLTSVDRTAVRTPVTLFADGRGRIAAGALVRARAVLERAGPTDQAA